MQINIHESKLSLSQLVEYAIAGEEVVLDEAGEPIAKIIPYHTKQKPSRQLGGSWEGKIWIADDFDETPKEIAEAFGIDDE